MSETFKPNPNVLPSVNLDDPEVVRNKRSSSCNVS